MATYGFRIAAEDSSVLTMLKVEGGLEHLSIRSKIVTQEVQSHFSEMGSKLKGVFSELKGIIAGSLFAGGIFGGYEFIKASKEAYENLEKSVVRVNTVLASTKYAAGLSGNEIEEQAKDLSKSITAGRAQIMDAQGMLLSFTGIKGPMFERTTKAVADFATFYKEDMTSAALQIGKALNNPEKGMSKLVKQGVALTEEQMKQIKLLQSQGKIMEAQAIIVKELETEFGGQAKAFAGTDAGKIEMAKKAWGSMKLEIGEVVSKLEVSLLPAFNSVVKYIKMAFESRPVQFFLEHLKDLLDVVLKAIPIWGVYKGLTMSIATANALAGLSMSELGFAFGAVTPAVEGATVAVEGFAVAWASLGVGVVAIGIGLFIEQMIKFNTQLDDAIDKVTNLKNITQNSKVIQESFEKVDLEMSNFNGLNTSQKRSALSDAMEAKSRISDEIAKTILPSIYKANYEIAKLKPSIHHGEGVDHEQFHKYRQYQIQANKAYDQLKNDKGLAEKLNSFITRITSLKDKKGHQLIKPLGGSPGDAIKQSATNISELSGAKGGLGEAKQIHIHIDTMQKVSVANGQGWEKSSQNAIELLIRTLNNMAYSQSSTM